MKAAVLDGVGSQFEVRELDLDKPKSGELLVKVAASGLCASDLNAVDGKRKLVPFPAVIGHEAAGVVVEVGPDTTGFAPGDHVIMSIVPNCGTCDYCKSGRPNYCSTAGSAMGVGGLFDGTSRLSYNGEKINHFLTVASFAEYVVVPASGAVVIPQEMPLDRAALISCAVLTGYGAVMNTAKVRAGSRVAVFGCGGVGLNIVQGARIAGARTIIAIDVTEEKLEIAKKVGATHTINASTSDPVAEVKKICGGVDYAFEALGRESTIQQAWGTVDVDGGLILVGLLKNGATLTLDAGPFVNEQWIKGCYFGSSNLHKDVPELVKSYLNGHLFLDELISERIGLEGLNLAFDRLRAGEGARNVLVFD
ncbi:MAG: alcohol dehydrogenase catalytic domain-containing protein [Actinobacteria bacterium]|nr:alcohol dehydrogenase catalytic domain-containing protein [Actinomycetota bacterium]